MADLVEEAKKGLRELRKGTVDIFPDQLYLKCNTLEIHSDRDPRHTRILIDGKLVTGVYSAHITLNSQRLTKAELGVFLDDCNLNATPKSPKPRDQERSR